MCKITLLVNISLFSYIIPLAQADTFTSAKVTPKFDGARGLIAIVANTSLSPLHLEKLEVSLDGGVKPQCTFLSNQAIQLGAGERAEVNIANFAAVQNCLDNSESAVPLTPLRGLRMTPMTWDATIAEPSNQIALRMPKQAITINASWLYRESQRQSQHHWSVSHQ